jgi:hypothetical protein
MPKLLTAALAALLCCAPAQAQGQAQDARAIVDKAVQAQGGMDAVTKSDAGYRKLRGQFHRSKEDPDGFVFTGETYGDTGHRLKVTLRGSNGQTYFLITNGDKGWDGFGFESVIPFDAKRRRQTTRSAHVDKVTGLVALVKDKDFTLTVLGDRTVKGVPAVAVKVQYPGMPDVELSFARSSGFLIKSAYVAIDVNSDKEVFQEIYYSNFELFDPAAEPLAVLQAAKADIAPAALLKFLKERVPTDKERVQIEALVPELGRTSYSARQKASAALEKYGAKAAAALRQAAKGEDQEAARRAEQLLEKITQGDEPKLATAAVRLLAVLRPAGTAEALLAYYPSACDDAVANEVLYALVTVVEADVDAKLVVRAALKDADPRKQFAAEAVLGRDGGTFLKLPGRRIVVEGLRFARSARLFRGGQPYADLDTTDHAFFNRLDESLFNPPNTGQQDGP